MRLNIQPNKYDFVHSPFKSEKNPSCKIYFKTDTFFDYSTSKGGDIIDFYCALYNCDKGKAINELKNIFLLNDTTLPSPKDRSDIPEKPIQNSKETDILKCLSSEEKEFYYERCSIANDMIALREIQLKRLQKNKTIFNVFYSLCIDEGWNEKAKYYLINGRRISEKSIEKFKLFNVSDYHRINARMKKVFPISELKRSGLYNKQGNLIFFKHSIIIPYLHKNDIIYMRGRYFFDGTARCDNSKYIGLCDDGLGLNTGKRIFNHDVIKKLKPNSKVFICEGEFDCISTAELGYAAVGIPGVGNLNEKLLKPFNELKPCLLMDQDEAGKQLTFKLIEYFTKNKVPIYAKLFPEEFKDVSDFLKKMRESNDGR